ncbi:hypothetical protein C7476_102483 [Phyllobacterium bourgognense]|uniref:Uncharacterized protein n=1 Tax=Phyllobacterium bourgognense TaxID=314236 RepID=A0A368Z217_9HYPH|nr:hypothetical protein C7476_102483 [Phyllobacterium bourgognense]
MIARLIANVAALVSLPSTTCLMVSLSNHAQWLRKLFFTGHRQDEASLDSEFASASSAARFFSTRRAIQIETS